MSGVEPWKTGNQLENWVMREGSQVEEHQIDREAIENGIEAGASRVWVCGIVDDNDNGDPVVLMAFGDDGHGMESDEHRDYMRTLLNTGSSKTTTAVGADENAGVGARLASLARNPGGVDSYSRTPAEAAAGQPWHHIRMYPGGAYRWDIVDDDGDVVDEAILVDAEDAIVDQFLLPGTLKEGGGTPVESGCFLVLRGDGIHDSFTEEQWKESFHYLTQRYWTFPNSVRAWVNGESIPALAGKKREDYSYEINPLSGYYGRICTGKDHSGAMHLSDGATAMWFVADTTLRGTNVPLDERIDGNKKFPTGPKRTNAFKGISVLDHNELFAHHTRFQQFGIIGQRATSRVSIVIIPPPGTVAQTTNRQNVVPLGGGELPWQKWGDEFSDPAVFPDVIASLMESDFKPSDTIKASDLDRLNPDWYKHVTSKVTLFWDPAGDTYAEEDRAVVAREGGRRRTGPPRPSSKPGPPRPRPGGNTTSVDRRLARKTTKKKATGRGREINAITLEWEAHWCDEKEWEDTVPDSDADIARVRAVGWAWVDRSHHRIYMRRNGNPYRKTYTKFIEGVRPAKHSKIRKDVESAYSAEVIAKVVHITEGIPEWSDGERADEISGLHLSSTLAGLNSVDALVALFGRSTT